MNLGIAGRVALIAGGSRGLGRATAELLAAEGVKVVVAARDESRIEDSVRGIVDRGGRAIGVSADVSTASGVARAVDAAKTHFGSPDIVVSSVRHSGDGNFEDVSPEDFISAFETLVLSVAHLARAVVPDMKRQRWGRIVIIGSGSAKEPPPELRHVLGNTVRASGVTLCKSLANELGPHGITVNTMGTGLFQTREGNPGNTVGTSLGLPREEAIAAWCQNVPARRPGTPEEMAGICAFLCSEWGGYITGQLIMVDGGFGRSAW